MNFTLPQHLINAIESKKLIPFIGSGFSKPFNLPTWNELMSELVQDLGYTPDIAFLCGDNLQLAEFLIQKKGLSSVRSHLDRRLNIINGNIQDSQAHMLLTEIGAPVMYTTNWDELIERAYYYKRKPYGKVSLFSDIKKPTFGKTEIVKFHGDFSSGDETLVFTESSYFDRLDFESPLDIKLRADMLSSTFIFLGYSMSDYNIRYMWHRLKKISQSSGHSNNEPSAYIVMAQPNPIFESICDDSGHIKVINLDPLDIEGSLISLMEDIVRYTR
jgi:hypothetical protein